MQFPTSYPALVHGLSDHAMAYGIQKVFGNTKSPKKKKKKESQGEGKGKGGCLGFFVLFWRGLIDDVSLAGGNGWQ